MNLSQFRQNPELVAYAAKLIAQPRFQALLAALREQHPKNFRGLGEHIGDNAHYKLGRIDGYDEFDNNLMSAAIPKAETNAPLEPTFQADQTEDENE